MSLRIGFQKTDPCQDSLCVPLASAAAKASCAARRSTILGAIFAKSKTSRYWVTTFCDEQATAALEGRRRFLARFEYPSIWETQEMQEHLEYLYTIDASLEADLGATHEDDTAPHDPDADKPRVTVAQYVAPIGQEVVFNLEGRLL